MKFKLPPSFTPALFSVFQEGYTREHFIKDLFAGIIVGIVALPLAIAFAIASGVSPQAGLTTAIIAGFVTAILGGSRVQVSGPTGAFIVVIYGIVLKYGYDGLAIAGFMAGVLLILMGIAKFGTVLRFIPFPVTVGFTTGIAVTIATGQIPAFLGFELEKDPADFLHKVMVYVKNIDDFHYETLSIGLLALLISISYHKFALHIPLKIFSRLPGSLVSIVITAFLVKILELPIATIGDKFGELHAAIPAPRLPNISIKLIQDMFQPALTIAMLAGIESLLSAVVADGMTGHKHRSNMELIAHGAANIISPIFGGIPSTGAIARTATNIKNGGRTPVSAIIHAFTLLLILFFLGKLAAYIPMATLSAILFIVSYNMSDWRTFVKIFKAPKSDLFILLLTFSLTVFFSLTVAIQVGVMAGAFLFIRRMSEVSRVNPIQDQISLIEEDTQNDPYSISMRKIPKGVAVYEIFGSFFFGAIDKYQSIISGLERKPKVLIVRTRSVFDIDSSGLHFLEDLLQQCRKNGVHLLLSGVRAQPKIAMRKSGFLTELGEENLPANIDLALHRADEFISETSKNSLCNTIPQI
ncbi:sodium-independent anion transporter [Fibrobacterales bacterium]|nr:sodium-independent anion transporter [Fibrobacterales bacterium]